MLTSICGSDQRDTAAGTGFSHSKNSRNTRGRGVSPSPLRFIFWIAGLPPSPAGPARGSPPSLFHRFQTIASRGVHVGDLIPVMSKGGGGCPLPPLTSFFEQGPTPLPMPARKRGHPPTHDFWDGPPMTGVSVIFKSPGLPPTLQNQKSKEN